MSGNLYETRYGVTFNGKHSFRDYRLLPTTRPTISSATVNTFYVTVPGADGLLDLTESLTGYPTFGNRQGEFNFQIFAPKDEWYNVYNQLVYDLHGKTASVTLDEDEGFYYSGRLSVETPTYGKNKANIKITGSFAAVQYADPDYSGNDWLWNPFDFDNGIAREYYQINVKGSKPVTLIGSEATAVPMFTLESGNVDVLVNGVRHHLNEGDNVFLNVIITRSNLNITLKGQGIVTITYRIGGGG